MQIWPLVQKNFIYIKRKPNASLTTFMVTILGVFILLTTSNITYNNNKQRHQSITSTNLTFPDARHKFPYFHDIAIVSTNHTVYNYIEYLLSHYTPGTNSAYYREPFENRNVTKQYDLVIEIIAEKDNLHFDIKGAKIFVDFYYNHKDNDLILINNVNDYHEGFIEKINFIYILLTEFIVNYFNLNLKPKSINLQIMKMSYNTINDITLYEKVSMSIMPILYTMLYFPLFFQFVLWMVNEKEQKLKDLLFRQGVTVKTYFASFQITFLIVVLIPIILSTYVLHKFLFYYLSYGIVFLFLFLFIFNFIAIGYLMQSLLSSSRTGQTLAKMFFISITILSSIVKQPECSSIPKMFFCLFPQMLFSISFEMLGVFNALGYEISLLNIDALFLKYHGYTLFKIIFLYVFDFFFYIGIALFIEELRLTKMDCLQYIKLKVRTYMKKQLQSSLVDFDRDDNVMYGNSNSVHMRNGNDVVMCKNKLTMKHIRKWYNNGDIKALNNFNCELYSGEIYVLLGHNGAGKSTLIKIISGMEDADKGDILLNNNSILQNKRLLFQNIGLCSQEDFYFPELTVKEHLELMTKLKGKNVNYDEINNLMEMINMKSFLDRKASTLSGGQKRKLSISLALIGGSNLVLLDEPTSGMDYKSKKFIWDFLKKYKKDKIILLTTHSLEEAEYLHDYIGIMNEGEYVCSGTSEYLKSKYSSGVNINFILDSDKTNKGNVINFLKKIKEIEPNCLIKALSNELLILHLDNVNMNLKTLMNLFNFISQYKHQYNIKNYNISTSSLEDVFLKINNNASSKAMFNDIEKAINSNQQEKQAMVFIDTDVSQFDLNTKLIIKRNFFVELKSNLYRNYISLWRNKFNFIFEIVSSLLIIAILLISLESILNQYSSFKVKIPSLNTKLTEVYFNDYSNKNNNNNNYISSYFKQMKYPQMKFRNTNRDLTLLQPKEYDNMFYESSKYFTEKAILILTESNDKQDNFVLLTRKDTPEEIILISNILFNLYLKNEYNINIKPAKRNDQIIRSVTQYIRTSSPFNEIIYICALNLITIILVVMLLVNLSGFNIITPLKERLNNVKQLQFLSGANTFAYWTSFLIVDTSKMFGFVLLLTPLLLIYLSNCIIHMIIFILCFIVVINLVVYLFSFYANKEEEGQQSYLYWMTIFTIILPFLGLIHFTFVAANSGGPKEEDEFFDMMFNSFIIDLFPSSSLIVGLFKLWICSIFLQFDGSEHNETQVAQKIMSHALRRHLFVSFIQFIVCAGILYMLEMRMFDYVKNYCLNKCVSRSKQSLNQVLQTYRGRFNSEEHNNEYVIQEKEKITKETQGHTSNILTTKIENLSKTYYMLLSWKENLIPAVRKLYLGLNKNEKFGLLGSNGSGKSTTFKCLINELLYEQGNITFFSHNSKKDFELIRQNTGYCSQENSLFDYLTVKETLIYYAQMKKVKTPVLELSTKFGLENYLNHQCIHLSGGNKRKLSFAIAIMNNPKIILLDEPSTGVDPQSRRTMWRNLSLISTHSISYNMILSTHSIEEAEILCDRIGWMEKGNFTCIGNPEELKMKFSDGYYCKIKFNINETCIQNNSSSNGYLQLKQNVLNVNEIINEETKNGNIWRLNLLWNVINAIKDNCGTITFISCDNDSTYTLNINLIEAQKGNVFAWLLYAKNDPQYEIKEFGLSLKPLEMVFDSMNSQINI